MGFFDSSNDSISEMLDNAARNSQMDDNDDDDDEWEEDDFDFRPDVTYRRGSTYSVRVSRSLVCQCVAIIIGFI